MREVIGGISINEKEVSPLSEYVLDFLCDQKKESPFLDLKQIINIRKGFDFPEIVKDILGFSNRGGGWILLGWKEYKKNQSIPIGLPSNFELDQATLQEKFNSFVKDVDMNGVL